MIRIAITGGIACGKSTVAAMLAELGVPVCDADDLARDALAPGAPQLRQVAKCFGAAVLLPGGGLDRAALAACIFRDEGARRRLEAIVHPVVRAAWTQWLTERDSAGCLVAAVVIPLLFEGSFTDGWSVVTCVTAGRDVQVARLAVRGLREDDAVRWMAAQIPVREKERRSDFVVINNASKAVLRRQVERVLNRIVEKAA